MSPRTLIGSRRTVPVIFSFKLLEAAAAAGVDARRLPTIEFRPGDVDGFKTHIPYEAQLDLWEAVMRATNDPGFPVFAASHMWRSHHDIVGFACMTRSNLGDAIHRVMHHQSLLWGDAGSWDADLGDRTITLTLSIDEPFRLGVRSMTEYRVAAMIHMGRTFTGCNFSPLEVRFRHPRPTDTLDIEAFFNAPVIFGAPQSELVLDAALLDTPYLKADPELAAFFERQVNELVERGAGEGMARCLRAVLTQDLARGVPTLESAATRLAVSTRTLARRLKEEGTTFQDILDEVRCELAKRCLKDDKLPLGEVAFLLGFSEPSAFHRAFKRWTGQTPLAYRQRSLPAS